MIYTAHYTSPLGGITLVSDGIALTGLYFDGETGCPPCETAHKKDLPVFGEVVKWLDLYFAGKEPDFSPALNPTGTTFQMSVWEVLRTIREDAGDAPCGQLAGLLHVVDGPHVDLEAASLCPFKKEAGADRLKSKKTSWIIPESAKKAMGVDEAH